MKYVAIDNNLDYGNDVKLLTVGTASNFTQYLSDNLLFKIK